MKLRKANANELDSIYQMGFDVWGGDNMQLLGHLIKK